MNSLMSKLSVRYPNGDVQEAVRYGVRSSGIKVCVRGVAFRVVVIRMNESTWDVYRMRKEAEGKPLGVYHSVWHEVDD